MAQSYHILRCDYPPTARRGKRTAWRDIAGSRRRRQAGEEDGAIGRITSRLSQITSTPRSSISRIRTSNPLFFSVMTASGSQFQQTDVAAQATNLPSALSAADRPVR